MNGFYLQRNSQYSKEIYREYFINFHFSTLLTTGLIFSFIHLDRFLLYNQFGISKHFDPGNEAFPSPCPVEKTKTKSGQAPLKLNQLSGVFIILGIGYILSLVAFAVEVIRTKPHVSPIQQVEMEVYFDP